MNESRRSTSQYVVGTYDKGVYFFDSREEAEDYARGHFDLEVADTDFFAQLIPHRITVEFDD